MALIPAPIPAPPFQAPAGGGGPPPAWDALLLESGDDLLLETGDRILLE